MTGGGSVAAAAAARRPSLLLLGLLVALNALGIDSYVVALPTMQQAFGVDPAAMQGSVSAYLVGIAAGQALWGWSSDALGRRRPLLAALALFVAGSIGCAGSGTLAMLLVWRFLQAFGSAGAGAIAYALAADHWQPDLRPRIYARLGQLIGLAAIVAPLAGSAVLAAAGWRTIFATLALVATATLVLAYRAPALRVGAAQTSATFVLIGEFGWSSGSYAGFYAVASVAFILASQINVALLARASAGAILAPACAAIAVIGGALTMLCLSGRLTGGAYAVATGLALGMLGLVLGNALAVAMAQVPAAIAGRASSLLGVVQFGMGAAIAAAATAAAPVSLSVSATILGTAAAALGFAVVGARATSRTVGQPSNFS